MALTALVVLVLIYLKTNVKILAQMVLLKAMIGDVKIV